MAGFAEIVNPAPLPAPPTLMVLGPVPGADSFLSVVAGYAPKNPPDEAVLAGYEVAPLPKIFDAYVALWRLVALVLPTLASPEDAGCYCWG